MKLASMSFLSFFVYSHFIGSLRENLTRPLSTFREGHTLLIGYLMFALLLVISGFMLLKTARLQRSEDVSVFGTTTFLLLVITVTPSDNDIHILCSIFLFLTLFIYYCIILSEFGRVWLSMNLAIPFVILVLTGVRSYGLWQKSYILYLLLVINMQYHLISKTGFLWKNKRTEGRTTSRTSWNRRKVFVVPSDQTWLKN